MVLLACSNCGSEFGCEDRDRCEEGKDGGSVDASGAQHSGPSVVESERESPEEDGGIAFDAAMDDRVDADAATVAPSTADGGNGSLWDSSADAVPGDDAAGHVDASDSAASVAPSSETCDFALSRKSGCVPPDSLGVFVSTTGDNLNSGTRESPVLTIGAGLSLAKRKGLSDVYVCGTGGAYAPVSVDSSSDGLRMFGGFDCVSWRYVDDAEHRTRVVSSGDEIALRIKDVPHSFAIEDFSFFVPSARQIGGTSIGAFVSSSAGVRWTRVRVEAAAGRDGADGVAASNWTETDPRSPTLRGYNADDPGGAQTQLCEALCVDGQHGMGGAGGTSGGEGSDGLPAYPISDPVTATGKGGLGGRSNPHGTQPGADGSSGPSGSGGAGAAQHGVLDDLGWHPAPGRNGSHGKPGQGGGGGGGPSLGGSGGGGACGGCGGAGGPGGSGGGSSFALLIYYASVKLESCELVAGAAGTGGKGAPGQPGEPGGVGGAGTNCVATGTASTCSGGNGGTGGGGGGGGGGAGGLSVAVGYLGNTAPEVDSMTGWSVAPHGAAGGPGGPAGLPTVCMPDSPDAGDSGVPSAPQGTDGGACGAARGTAGAEGLSRMAFNLRGGS